MIVTDKFVFAHLPRSGGTFVGELVKKFWPSARDMGHHLPREFLPSEYSHLPILGTIRNPWEFYVSLYHYVWRRDPDSILVRWMSDGGRSDFTSRVTSLLNLTVDEERLSALIEMLPDRLDYDRRNIPNITKDEMRRVRGAGFGYYTFRFKHIYGNAEGVFFCHVESLRQDLLQFFENIGVLDNELRDYVLSSEKKNASQHFHYSSYYTPEVVDLVAVRDHLLLERFGYDFEPAQQVSNKFTPAST